MSDVIPFPAPLAVRLGFTHVSVAQGSTGRWLTILWHRDVGTTMLGIPASYDQAVARARVYVDAHPSCVLDLPEGRGAVHVRRSTDGSFEVMHESSSGESFASLRIFGPHERDEAVRFALSQIPQYAPCRLGEVASWA